MSVEEKIAEIEKEISRTQRNKATEAHLGLLRSRLAKLRAEAGIKPQKAPQKPPAKGKNASKKGPAPPKEKPKHKRQNTGSSSESEREPSESESSSEVDDTPSGSVFSKFAVLQLEDEEGDEQRNATDGGDEQSGDGTSATRKKPKKKKRNRTVSKGGEGDLSLSDMTEEQLMEYFEKQNKPLSNQNHSIKASHHLTGIDPRYLNYRYEFQKSLGKGASAFLDEGAGSSHGRGKPTVSRGVHHLFVNPGANMDNIKDFVDRYVRIEQDPAHPGHLVFKRTKRYKELQKTFLLMVYSHQDQVIQDVLHEFPFHTDALILMSNLYERDENIASARQVIENALTGLQQCFDHQQRNNPQSHRFSYKYPANRSYFVLLFKHINLIASRFPTTALEIGKYLFNLSPVDDPLAMILFLDHLALKAKDYAYLVAFYRTLNAVKNLDMLPNFCYSYALALFRMASSSNDSALMIEAEEALRKAIVRFPMLLVQLFEKIGPALLESCHCRSFMRSSDSRENHGLDLLQALYVRRSHSLWDDTAVISFMVSTDYSLRERSSDASFKEELDRCAERRRIFANATPSNIWRHITLLNIPDSERVFHLQLGNETQTFVFPFDPIPPSNSEEKDEYDLKTALQDSQTLRTPNRDTDTPLYIPDTVEAEGEGGMMNVFQQILNATGEFFHSILPSVAVNAAEVETPALLNGEVIVGAPIQDDQTGNGDLVGYLDQVAALRDELSKRS